MLPTRIMICLSRSRQQWYGNTDPEHQGVVHTEIAHVWPGVSGLVYSSEDFSQVSLALVFGLVCFDPFVLGVDY